MNKTLWFFLKIALSTALTWYLLRDIESVEILKSGRSLNLLFLLLAFFQLLIHFIIVSWRWGIVLRALDERIPIKMLLKISYISIFFNQVLPASIGGDVVRIYMIRDLKVSLLKAFNSTVIDRIASLISIALMILVTSPLLFNKIISTRFSLFIILGTLISLVGFFALFYLDKFLYFFRNKNIIKKFLEIYPDVRRTFYIKSNSFPLLFVSTLGNINLSIAIYFISKSLGIEISIINCIILFPPVLLLASIPISFAGWGIREGAMVTAFSYVGVNETSALTISMFFGLLSVIVNLPAGLFWAVTKKNNF